MRIRVEKSFDRDIEKINDKRILDRLLVCIDRIEKSSSLSEIRDLKKMQNRGSYYRIRIGNYRLGIELTPDNEVILLRFLHRKEIYRFFPTK